MAASSNEPGPSTIKSCILLFYYGGPSQLDIWDPKPDAPLEVRGEFAPIATTVAGRSISEKMPHTARVMDRIAVIRSMHHPMRNHNSAAVEALCGRTPIGGDLELLANNSATDFPCYGSALSYMMPEAREVPPHVALPHVMYNVVMLPGQTAGFLGSAFEPWQVTRDPSAPDFKVSEIELPSRLSLGGLEDRRTLLEARRSTIRAARGTGRNAFHGGLLPAGLLDSQIRGGSPGVRYRSRRWHDTRSLRPHQARAKRAVGPAARRVGRADGDRLRPRSQRPRQLGHARR